MTYSDTIFLRAKDNTGLNSSPARKSSVVIIGPTPPPYHGVSVSTEKLLVSYVKRKFEIYHVELGGSQRNPACRQTRSIRCVAFSLAILSIVENPCFQTPIGDVSSNFSKNLRISS